MSEQQKTDAPIKSRIGGQALIEGVMMRGLDKSAMAVRQPDGEISVTVSPLNVSKAMQVIGKIPIVRGVFNFVQSIVLGYRSLGKSAEIAGLEEEEGEPSRFEKWLDRVFGDHLMKVITSVGMVLGVAACILLFVLLPSLIVKGLDMLFPLYGFKSLIEGVLKMGIFIGYLALVTRMKEIHRVFQYHGAEHKTIACYEAGEELTVENVKHHRRFHPRCGTSFLLFVMIVSIILFSLLPRTGIILRMLMRLALLPVVAGLSYEIIKLAGRSKNKCVAWLTKPGLWLQKLTTNEPDETQIEVAIASMKAVIPEDKSEDRW